MSVNPLAGRKAPADLLVDLAALERAYYDQKPDPSDPGARVKGLASITVALESVALADGRTLKLDTSAYRKEANASKGKDAKKIGIATGVGAAIGAIAGGGKGAAIGAGVGGGAGTGAVLATRGDPAVIPAETRIRFTLESPVTIVEQRTQDR